MMSSAGVPVRVIQEISGHNDLGTLQRYLEVSPEQKRKAISVIGF
jgi:integrase/recombinase XerD